MEEVQEALDELASALNIGSQWSALMAIAKALRIIAAKLQEGE